MCSHAPPLETPPLLVSQVIHKQSQSEALWLTRRIPALNFVFQWYVLEVAQTLSRFQGLPAERENSHDADLVCRLSSVIPATGRLKQ